MWKHAIQSHPQFHLYQRHRLQEQKGQILSDYLFFLLHPHCYFDSYSSGRRSQSICNDASALGCSYSFQETSLSLLSSQTENNCVWVHLSHYWRSYPHSSGLSGHSDYRFYNWFFSAFLTHWTLVLLSLNTWPNLEIHINPMTQFWPILYK